MTDTSEPEGRRGELTAGSRVEVRTGLDGSWATGFEIAEAVDGGYRLRRRRDGEILPVAFPAESVRRERKKAMWWY